MWVSLEAGREPHKWSVKKSCLTGVEMGEREREGGRTVCACARAREREIELCVCMHVCMCEHAGICMRGSGIKPICLDILNKSSTTEPHPTGQSWDFLRKKKYCI